MKSITELLDPESESTLKDWYQYAQSMYMGIDFSGADDSTPALTQKIEKSLSVQQLTPFQLRCLSVAAQAVIDRNDTADDAFMIISWGAVTHTIIQEELNRRLQQTSPEPVSSKYMASLLETIQAFSVVIKRKPEWLFQDYAQYTQAFVESTQQEISIFKHKPTVYLDLESLAFLQREEDYLKSPAPTEEKLLRQCEMFTNLSYLEAILGDYKDYVKQTKSDYQTQKLEIIEKLEAILQDKTLPPAMKMYGIENIIQTPENKAVIEHDSLGEKLLKFIHKYFSIFFTETETKSEFYKDQLLTLKQKEAQTLENVAESDETHRRGHSNH